MAFSYVDTLGFKDAINGGKPLKPATQFTINCLGAGEQVGTVMAINAAGIATACTVVAWTDTLLTLITPPNIVEGVGYRVEVTLYGENIPAYYGETKADTFADLRTIEPTIENQIITLIGHTVAGIGGGTFRAVLDGSGLTDDNGITAVTSDGAGWIRNLDGFISPQMFGALESLDDCYTQIQSCANYIKLNSNSGIVDFEGSLFNKKDNSGKLNFNDFDNIELRNGGIYYDDTDTNVREDLITFDNSERVYINHFNFNGSVYDYPSATNQSQTVTGVNCGYVILDKVNFKGQRYMATAFTGVRIAGWVQNCTFTDIIRDGARFVGSANIYIKDNYFKNVSDDCIAVHSENGSEIIAENVIVSNNIIEASQGIKILGGKKVIISENIMNRMIRNSIEVSMIVNNDFEGSTPLFSVSIINNKIHDSLSGFGASSSILVYTDEPRNYSVGYGVKVAPYSVNYDNDILATQENAAIEDLLISGNTISRTLPTVSSYSEWGYGDYILDRNSVGLFIDPEIQESNFNLHGAVVKCPVSNFRFLNNKTSAGVGFTGLSLGVEVGNNQLDFVNCEITGNTFYDCGSIGIDIATPNKNGSCTINIKRNAFDIDPFFKLSGHNADNTWSTSTSSYGIRYVDPLGITVSGNSFKNCARTGVTNNGVDVIDPNIIYSDFVAHGDSASNKGVRVIPEAFANKIIPIQGDPLSSDYGLILNNVPTSKAGSPPSTGKFCYGTVIYNSSPNISGSGIKTGWWRISTGTGNIIGTDWVELWSDTTA